MKKSFLLALLLVLITLMSACANTTKVTSADASSESLDLETKIEETEKKEKKIYKIGLGQFAEHGSLDNCRIGFIEGMKEEGFVEGDNVVYEYDNAQTDGSVASQIYNKYVTQKSDLVLAIATPMAQVAYSICSDKDIPVIFSAITDPVAADLANPDGTPVGNITGTSDKLPVEAQLKLITNMFPDAKNIGILYTTSEVNSVSAIEEYKSLSDTYGVNIVVQSIDQGSDMPLAVDTILPKVDVMTNLTDNTVVANLPVLLEKANEKKIPVFGSEIEQVHKGCIAAMGLDYVELGKQTGHMAARVLKGESDILNMNYEIIENASLYLNEKVIENLGIQIEDSLKNTAVEVFTDIAE